MLTAERQQTTAPATTVLKQIRIPIGEYKAGSYSFFEACLDLTEINHHSKRLVAFAYWDMKKPYPKHHQPLDFSVLDAADPIAKIAMICAPPPTEHNQELIVFTDYSAKLVVNAHVTLEFKTNTFLISPSEHWRFQ